MPQHPPMRPHPRYNPSLSDIDPLSVAVGVGAAAVVWWFFLRQKPAASIPPVITPRVQAPAPNPALPPAPPPGTITPLEQARAYLAAAETQLADPTVTGDARVQAQEMAENMRAKIAFMLANP